MLQKKRERERHTDQNMCLLVTYTVQEVKHNGKINYKTVSPKSGRVPLLVVPAYRALSGKIWGLWIDSHSWEVVAYERRLTVVKIIML